MADRKVIKNPFYWRIVQFAIWLFRSSPRILRLMCPWNAPLPAQLKIGPARPGLPDINHLSRFYVWLHPDADDQFELYVDGFRVYPSVSDDAGGCNPGLLFTPVAADPRLLSADQLPAFYVDPGGGSALRAGSGNSVELRCRWREGTLLGNACGTSLQEQQGAAWPPRFTARGRFGTTQGETVYEVGRGNVPWDADIEICITADTPNAEVGLTQGWETGWGRSANLTLGASEASKTFKTRGDGTVTLYARGWRPKVLNA